MNTKEIIQSIIDHKKKSLKIERAFQNYMIEEGLVENQMPAVDVPEEMWQELAEIAHEQVTYSVNGMPVQYAFHLISDIGQTLFSELSEKGKEAIMKDVLEGFKEIGDEK